MADIYQAVTDRIVAQLEQGTIPWVKPWNSSGKPEPALTPRNAVTGRPYNGINVVLLWSAAAENGYTQDRWLTFKQAKEAGGSVKKGETSTLACFYKPMKKPKLDDDGNQELDEEGNPKEERFAILRGFNLFNIDQCEGLPDEITEPGSSSEVAFSPHDEAEHVMASSGVAIEHVEGNKAFYTPALDRIRLPARHQFDLAERYYSTALHELVHSTGHQKRLAREGIVAFDGFGSPSYAREELVAELGMAYLCGQLGIAGELQDASYIANWIAALREDKRAIFNASGHAREAAEFLLERAEATPRQEASPGRQCA
ncbi:ArdC family protein [Halomonas caseinilytica]|uniref:ArdC family protein n=1 Tax=Halomonas caseinilytica TaxID=438744 RepID=UPI0007E544B3|nr:ArdC-like ssDNA-binding domain-containing protein [Halomonas caseinilytica]SEN20792.1 Antirestriction protein ArdC [Halomonas caseinilytica]